jgi:hypothetical protein
MHIPQCADCKDIKATKREKVCGTNIVRSLTGFLKESNTTQSDAQTSQMNTINYQLEDGENGRTLHLDCVKQK